jgi:hypothetical protein
MSTAPYAPTAPIGSDGAATRSFVEHVLRAQAEIGVDAYLLPGFVPRSRADDTRAMTREVIDVAVARTDLEPRPWIAYVGMHSEHLEAGIDLLGDVSRSVAAVYVQITPFKPQADTASKLLRCADLYEHAAADFTGDRRSRRGRGQLIRALGAHAADAGLAGGETFDFASKMRPRKPSDSLKAKEPDDVSTSNSSARSTVEIRAFEDAETGHRARSPQAARTGTSMMPSTVKTRVFEDAEIGIALEWSWASSRGTWRMLSTADISAFKHAQTRHRLATERACQRPRSSMTRRAQ